MHSATPDERAAGRSCRIDVVALVALIARIVLAAVFASAGIAKARRPAATAETAQALGVPRPLGRPLGVLLPGVELALAVWLVSGRGARSAAVAAALVLIAFSLVLLRALRAGRRPACNCFGATSTEPIGPGTLARNGALVLVAALGATSTASVAIDWTPALAVALAAAALAATSGAGLLLVLRQNGRLLRRIDALESARPGAVAAHVVPERPPGLPVGDAAPAIPGLAPVPLPTLVVFGDASCGPCDALLPEIAAWEREHADAFRIALLVTGPVALVAAKSSEHGVRGLLHQPDDALAKGFRYAGTPGATLVGADGRVLAPLASGAVAIRALVAATVAVAPALPVGSPPAPANGRLVLFFDPSCGYCQAMLPDLRAWEASGAGGAQGELLVVSRRGAEANAALGLHTPIVLDDDGAVMAAYGVQGTPIAVRIGGSGRVAGAPLVGATAVMAALSAVGSEVVG
jgi:protein-disulfide isomerase